MYNENEADLITALYKDLRKPKHEAKLMEIEVLKADVRTMIENCKEWSKPQRVCYVSSIIKFTLTFFHRKILSR